MGLKIKSPSIINMILKMAVSVKNTLQQKGIFFVMGGTFDKITSGTQDSKG